LRRYLDPAFGALPKAEIDLLVFHMLYETGLVDADTPQYDIARQLRITPSRVRALTFQRELRDAQQTDDALKVRLVKCLTTTRFVREDSSTRIVFGVEDPLLQADLTARLKKLMETPDYSFNREIVIVSSSAFPDLLNELLTDEQKEAVRKGLVKPQRTDTANTSRR
jgi:hypothetical protein